MITSDVTSWLVIAIEYRWRMVTRVARAVWSWSKSLIVVLLDIMMCVSIVLSFVSVM